MIQHVPVERAATPASGQVLVDHWWVHVPGLGLMFAGQQGQSPQCNPDEAVARMLQARLYPSAEIIHVPAVYLASCDRFLQAGAGS